MLSITLCHFLQLVVLICQSAVVNTGVDDVILYVSFTVKVTMYHHIFSQRSGKISVAVGLNFRTPVVCMPVSVTHRVFSAYLSSC